MQGVANEEKPVIVISSDWERVGHDLSREVATNCGFCACLESDGSIVAGVSYNMIYDLGAADRITLDWWQSTPELREAWAACTKDPRHPSEVMRDLRTWIDDLLKSYTFGGFVFYPSLYDGALLSNYWMRYNGKTSVFSAGPPNTYDIRSYASGALGLPYRECNQKGALAAYWPPADEFPHNHTGLDDAIEQAQLFFNIRKTVMGKK